MENEHARRASSFHAGKWAAWIAAALALYVLSIGPVSGWATSHPPSKAAWQAIDRVYQPVAWASGKNSAKWRLIRCEQWWENLLGEPADPGTVILSRRRPGEGSDPAFPYTILPK
jgi:hypothetical protein